MIAFLKLRCTCKSSRYLPERGSCPSTTRSLGTELKDCISNNPWDPASLSVSEFPFGYWWNIASNVFLNLGKGARWLVVTAQMGGLWIKASLCSGIWRTVLILSVYDSNTPTKKTSRKWACAMESENFWSYILKRKRVLYDNLFLSGIWTYLRIFPLKSFPPKVYKFFENFVQCILIIFTPSCPQIQPHFPNHQTLCPFLCNP